MLTDQADGLPPPQQTLPSSTAATTVVVVGLRKLSETSGTCSPVTSLKFVPRPCLKRRSSVPACRQRHPDGEAGGQQQHHHQHHHSGDGGCCAGGGSGDGSDSLDSRGCSMSTSSSSFSSKKSVSFADSIGEDLCQIKLFKMEQSELTSSTMEDSWTAKMWRWQQKMRSEAAALGSEGSCGDFYLGELDDEDNEEEEELGGGGSCSSDPEMEQEDTLDGIFVNGNDNFSEDDDDYGTNSLFRLDEEETPQTLSTRIRPAADPDKTETSIVPTFLQPKDLPGYFARLRDCLIGLEALSVVPDQSVVSGTICIRLPSSCKSGTQVANVGVRYSRDNWKTSTDVSATSFGANGERYGFVVGTGGMEIGDDLELVACALLIDERSGESIVVEDDNDGSKYRLICKSRSKFQPGKSLW